jgi:hypothetical protein
MFLFYMPTDYCSVQDWEQGTSANNRSPFGAEQGLSLESQGRAVCVFSMYNLAIHLIFIVRSVPFCSFLVQ